MQRKEFDNIASRWRNSEKTMRFTYRLLKKFVNKRDVKRIVDAGCGKGVIVPVLNKLYNGAEILCIDFSLEMLKHLEEEGCKKIQSRAELLPFKDGTANMVISVNAFPHFSDKKRFIYEAFRILKPGGLLIILHSINRKRINRFHRSLCGGLRYTHMPGRRDILNLFESAGFTGIKWYERKGLIIFGEKRRS